MILNILAIIIVLVIILIISSIYIRVGSSNKRRTNNQIFGRQLGLLERWYISFDVPRYFLQCASISGAPFDEVHVEKIMEVLVKRFPILSATIDFSPTVPVLAKLDMPHKTPFPVQVIEAPESEWKNEIGKQLNSFIFPTSSRPSPLPLWRLSVLRSPSDQTKFSVLMNFHHIVADGLSGVIFFKNFMAVHNDLLAGRTSNIDEMVAPIMEEVIDIRPYIFELLWELVVKKKPRTDYLGPKEQITPVESNIHYITLRQDVLAPLRDACKTHKVTLHGALSVALEFAAAKVNHPSRLNQESRISFTFPISLRRLAPNLNSNLMGLFVCGAEDHDVKIRNDSLFWEEAKRINTQMPNFTGAAMRLIGMLEFLPGSWEEFVNKKRYKGIPNKRVATIELSNLGQVDFSKENNEKHSIEELSFIIPNHIPGTVYLNSAATVGNVMTLVTTTPSPTISKEAGKTYQDAFLSSLKLACQHSSFKYSDLYN